jgi:hypothetical protein
LAGIGCQSRWAGRGGRRRDDRGKGSLSKQVVLGGAVGSPGEASRADEPGPWARPHGPCLPDGAAGRFRQWPSREHPGIPEGRPCDTLARRPRIGAWSPVAGSARGLLALYRAHWLRRPWERPRAKQAGDPAQPAEPQSHRPGTPGGGSLAPGVRLVEELDLIILPGPLTALCSVHMLDRDWVHRCAPCFGFNHVQPTRRSGWSSPPKSREIGVRKSPLSGSSRPGPVWNGLRWHGRRIPLQGYFSPSRPRTASAGVDRSLELRLT